MNEIRYWSSVTSEGNWSTVPEENLFINVKRKEHHTRLALLLIYFHQFIRFYSCLYLGTPLVRAPVLGHRDLDLFKLFKIVSKMKGMDKVCICFFFHCVYVLMFCFPFCKTNLFSF